MTVESLAAWSGNIVRGGEQEPIRERLAGVDFVLLVADDAAPVACVPWPRWVELLRAAGMSYPGERVP